MRARDPFGLSGKSLLVTGAPGLAARRMVNAFLEAAARFVDDTVSRLGCTEAAEVNTLGTVRMTQAAYRRMLRQRSGSISKWPPCTRYGGTLYAV